MGKKSKKGRSNTTKKTTNTTATNTATTADTNSANVAPSTVAPTPKEPVPTVTTTETKSPDNIVNLPTGLESSLSILTPSQKTLATELAMPPYNQAHIFAAWESASDTDKISFMEQLERMDKAYPSGGLKGYIDNARDLLLKSQQGVNPLEGWKPEVPQGESVDVGMENYDKFEKIGMEEMGKCGFALVAGGLGERLGYGGIKVREYAQYALYTDDDRFCPWRKWYLIHPFFYSLDFPLKSLPRQHTFNITSKLSLLFKTVILRLMSNFLSVSWYQMILTVEPLSF
jgi:hypothetical protein